MMNGRPKGLEKYGLIHPPKPKKRRLIASCEGSTGTGKSDFMLRTAPRNLLVLDFDGNLEPILNKYVGDEGVDIKHIDIPAVFDKDKKEDQARDYKLLMDIQDLYMAAIESDYYKAIFVDGGEYFWELARRGILGGGLEFNDVKRTEYAAANSFMRSFYDAAKSKRVSLVVSHQQKPEFKGPNATGNMVMEGWKKTTQCSQVHLMFYKEPGETGISRFRMKIVKCNANPDLEEQELVGDEISFSNLGSLVFPESDYEDWT